MSSILEQGAQIAQALKTDNFYLAPGAEETFGAKALTSARSKSESLDYPVYVVALNDADADSADLLTFVHANLQQDGLYILLQPGRSNTYAVETDNETSSVIYDQILLARDDGFQDSSPAKQLNLLLEQLNNPKTLTEQEAQALRDGGMQPGVVQPRAETSPSEPVISDAGMVMLGVLGIAIVVAAAGMGIAALRRNRAKRRYRLPSALVTSVRSLQRKELREQVGQNTLHVAARLEALKTQGLSEDTLETVVHGLDAYSLASRLVDDAASRTVDLAGALVLIRVAERDLFSAEQAADDATQSVRQKKGRKIAGRKSGPGPLALCVFNPLHREAESRADYRLDSGRKVSLPACNDCASAVRSRQEPDWLYDGDEPYASQKTVWGKTLFGAIDGDLIEGLQSYRG
ncbi:hypothetical protein LWF01_12425 [Saxibacter everestensis]|uniref:TPM domain-containing protein n=1 Tax=Saxibacter everestensis TaxID=2909229 RepID=A0ABY8QRF8_9MICO|nr:hypothetical protein LWF01_12425 [Brevibacteriaceae bacterium ZFBP1038]